jgi:hypothetical protein
VASSVFAGSFDYSYMMGRKGYFSSESGDYWSLVEKSTWTNTYSIGECLQFGDTLNCRKYSVNCDDGTLQRNFNSNTVYILGREHDYWSAFGKSLLSDARHVKTTEFIENKQKFKLSSYTIESDIGNLECSFIDSSKLNCYYTKSVIIGDSWEATLCNEIGEE